MKGFPGKEPALCSIQIEVDPDTFIVRGYYRVALVAVCELFNGSQNLVGFFRELRIRNVQPEL